MSTLTINIIPFEHPTQEKEFGFITEKRQGYYPLSKHQYPRSLWENYEDELQDFDRLYSNFEPDKDADFKATVDLSRSWKFADHFYTKSIYKYFLEKADAVKFGFVNDVEVWLKDNDTTNPEYTTYKRFSLRVQYAKVSSGMELAISFDGTSLVHKKSLAELTELPPERINKVLYNKEIYSFQREENQHLKIYIDELYPVLSNTILNNLQIERPFKYELNKYLPYYKEITAFYDTFLDADEFRKIIPIADNGFIEIAEENILKTKSDSNQLRFGKANGIEPKKDFLRLGPFKPSKEPNVRLIFIYHQADKGKSVKKLYNIFKKGLLNGNYEQFPSMLNAIKQNFYLDETKGIEFTNVDTAIQEVSRQLSSFNKVENTQYVAIYISPVKKDEKDADRLMLYYKLKELLLNQNITSQVIFRESLYNSSFKYYLPNIAIALLAKINGVPWRLDRDTKDDLVVGVGAFYSQSQKTKFIGSTFCFNNDGTFQGFNCFNSNETEMLAGEISKAIMKYVVDNHKQAKRLIVHFYKKISERELQPIYDVLKTFNWNIPVVVITVNKTLSNDYVAFDLNSRNLMPKSGSIVPIGRDQYLLFNNSRYGDDEEVRENPFPIKLTFWANDEEMLNDKLEVKELIDQVYQFSRMYWKSVSQQNLPVTIKYPEMVAEIFAYFKADSLPTFAQQNLWFL